MDPGRKGRLGRLVDPPVTLEAAEPGEGARCYPHPKMALPSGPVTGVAGMSRGLVRHDEALRRERRLQARLEEGGDGHPVFSAAVTSRLRAGPERSARIDNR